MSMPQRMDFRCSYAEPCRGTSGTMKLCELRYGHGGKRHVTPNDCHCKRAWNGEHDPDCLWHAACLLRKAGCFGEYR